MLGKIIISTVLALLVSCQLTAQISLERQVIGSYGILTNPSLSIQLSATGGESAIQTLSTGNLTLNQGFQQAEPEDLTSVFMAPELVSELSIFPNPCQGQCWVKLVPQVQSNLVLQAFDLHGRSIAQWGVQAFSGQELLIDIQTQSWPSGIYLFKLSDQSGRLLGSLRLAK